MPSSCYVLFLLSFLTGPGERFVGAEAAEYKQFIDCCDTLFEYRAQIGYEFTILNIGGGYPESEHSYKEAAPEISKYVAEFVGKYPRTEILSEPGVESYVHHY